jgi:proteasome maturation protein
MVLFWPFCPQYFDKSTQMDMAILKKTQGLHAPLRLQMERNATLKVGHLPFLPRHNASFKVLTGERDQSDKPAV